MNIEVPDVCPCCGDEYSTVNQFQRHTLSDENECIPLQVYYILKYGPIPANYTDEFPVDFNRKNKYTESVKAFRIPKTTPYISGLRTENRVYYLPDDDIKEVVSVYIENNEKIFEVSSIKSIYSLLTKNYPIDELREVFGEYFGTNFYIENL